MEWHFCMRHSNYGSWPRGAYCIFKMHGYNCPSGLVESYSYWDDEDTNNNNRASGYLPDGTYTHDTKIHFCCRDDGDPSNGITLPTSVPFILLAVREDRCQKVTGMSVCRQYFHWDDEDDRNANRRGGSSVRPYDEMNNGDHRLYFCYYS